MAPPTSPLPPPTDDLVTRLDTRLHEADMLRRFGTGAAAPIVFRHWHIERRLGRGGMGAVYLAVDQALNRRVALKLVPLRAGDPSPGNARVRDEARALAAISHPNVVQVFHVYLDDDSPVIEMEHIQGLTLRAWQAAVPRAWRDIVAAYVSGGDGVAAMHRAGLLHRDIKPENLLITPDGVVRVVDLGLALPANTRLDPHAPSRADTVAGTLGYIAPEVFAGAEPDHHSDQFSFCVALYEALLGVRPFRGDTPAELARAMGTGLLTRPTSAPALPRWLLATIGRGLSCDHNARHASMDDLVDALRRGLARAPTWTRRGGLAGIVVVLLGLGSSLRPASQDPCAAADVLTPLAVDQLATLRARVGPGPTPARRGLEVLGTILDARARAWASERGQLCRAPRTDGDPTAILARWRCIDRRHAELRTILDGAQAGRDLPADILNAVTAIEQLPACPDVEPAPDPIPERDAWIVERLAAALRHEDAGNYLEAERLTRDVVAGAGDSPRLPEALYRLGHVLGATDRSAAALRELERAENIATGQRRDELVCQILAYQVKLRASTELTFTEGERALGRADSCVRRTGTRAPLLRANMLEARGLLAAAADRPDIAVAHHQEALYLRRTHLGELHMDISKSLHNLGNALDDRRQPLAALRNLEAALALRQQLVGPGHPWVADILHDLGHLHAELEAPDRARQHYEQAAAILRAAGTPRAPVLADLELSLAELDLADGQQDAAAARLRQAHQLQAIDLDLAPSHPQRALLLHLEAALHEHRGDFASALPLLKEATRLLRTHAPDSDQVLTSALNEVPARYALRDHAGITALARDLSPHLLDYLRRIPAAERGQLAWYIGASQAMQRAPAAVPYLALALSTFRDQGATSEVLQLQQELSLAQRPRSAPPH